MTTVARLADLPRFPLQLHQVASREQAEKLAAQFPPESWYFESSDGKYKTLFTQPQENK